MSSPTADKWYSLSKAPIPHEGAVGVYRRWTDIARIVKLNDGQGSIAGVSFRKHSSLLEAVEEVRKNRQLLDATDANQVIIYFQTTEDDRVDTKKRTRESTEEMEPDAKRPRTGNTSGCTFEGNRLVIYTDGNCRGNGKSGAKAGVGVYFGDDHALNVAEPLQSAPQTNQRAELTAIKRAIEVSLHSLPGNPIKIYTDSDYSKKIFTEWIGQWKKRGWKKANGDAVLNTDIIKPIDALIEKAKTTMNTKDIEPVVFEWIRGHKGTHGNEMADQLATEGIMKH